MVQRRAARFIKSNYSREPGTVTTLLEELNLTPLETRRKIARILLFHKAIREKVAIPIPSHILKPRRTSRLHQPNTKRYPRDHRAKVCVWADLTVDDVDRISESLNSDHVRQVLADIFHLDDFRTNIKTGIVMDLYFYTIMFARENNFNREKTSAVFSIVKKTHEVCIETPFGNVDQTFNYFKEMVLCHAVNRPPHSIELFNADEVRKITEYTVNTYFRHFKMYKYAFTPLVRLDLSLSYVGLPVTPPPSEADETSPPEDEVPPEQTTEPTEGGDNYRTTKNS
ncbi:unnamed protein product [Mytilus edulis]|uniref:Uncharacterized protein n=1 Tax=Mytilus edulis TaxID=6550 RepID=A0A8S3U822_MYTED|nr:unnamed protein product [Mytilus edulis]